MTINTVLEYYNGLPWWLDGKESAWNWGDLGSIPGSGRSPGRMNTTWAERQNPLFPHPVSCLLLISSKRGKKSTRLC